MLVRLALLLLWIVEILGLWIGMSDNIRRMASNR